MSSGPRLGKYLFDPPLCKLSAAVGTVLGLSL